MKRWMGLDVGTRVIGIAISDPLKLTARPLLRLERTSLHHDVSRLLELARCHDVERFVVGRPDHLDGRPSLMSTEIAQLADALRESSSLPLVWFNESLSSKEAERLMAELGVKVDQRRRRRDEVAAALILQWYLDEADS